MHIYHGSIRFCSSNGRSEGEEGLHQKMNDAIKAKNGANERARKARIKAKQAKNGEAATKKKAV
jgi:hypothetical protein